MKNEEESFYFRLGFRIGWWYAANRHSVHHRILEGLVYRLPGGRWFVKTFR